MRVRDIRLKWPEAERALAREREIIVTRDSKPVARILPYEAPERARREWARFGRTPQTGSGSLALARFEALLGQDPYAMVDTPPAVIDVAEEHLRRLPREAHCPMLDRLHLAAMEAFNLRRLLTNAAAQARAARALGFAVIMPRTTRSEPR